VTRAIQLAARAIRHPIRAFTVSRKLAAARLPFLAAKEHVYDTEFFRSHDAVQDPMYDRIADAIAAVVRPRSVVDIGCGTGRIISRLAETGVAVQGVEGSRHAIELSPVSDRIVRHNLEHGVPDLGRFDLALCIEVAEHLPERSAGPLVAGLARSSDRVVFTAATPGQGGTHHVNEQPHDYWIELFYGEGFERSTLVDVLREAIADLDEPAWIRANLMTFERVAVSR
jgi:SAM-dependent methyltransferase